MLRSAGFSLPAFARTSVAGDETREVASAAPVPFHRKPLAGVREAIEACGATLMPTPLRSDRRIAASSTLGRPSVLPCAFARLRPAITLSRISAFRHCVPFAAESDLSQYQLAVILRGFAFSAFGASSFPADLRRLLAQKTEKGFDGKDVWP